MSRKRLLIALYAVGGLLVVYVVALVIIGWAIEGKVKRGVAERLSTALQAEVTIDDCAVSLLRGRVAIRGVKIRREGAGFVKIDVARIDAGIPPFGLAMFDGTPDLVSLDDVEIQLSPLAFKKRKKAKPMRMGGLEVKNVRVTLVPTPLMPKIGRAEVRIEYARTGAMEMRSGLSWLFHMKTLKASGDLPKDVKLEVEYAGEQLSLKGPIFNNEPLRFHFPLPAPNPDALETQQAVDLGKALAKALVKNGGKALVHRYVKPKPEP